MPEEIFSTEWDVIFVDAPAGYSDFVPGRMKSIYMASVIAKRQEKQVDVFVHDCNREVEIAYCDTFLGESNLWTSVDRLRHYVFTGTDLASSR